LEVGLPPTFFLEQEGAIDLLLTFSDWDCPAQEDDIRAAISLLVPKGCGTELIRLGGNGDGAYLLPDLLDGVEACFSPGVSTQTAFEMELAERYRIPAYLCDASVQASQLQLHPELHTFTPQWLGSYTGGNTTTLDAWVAGSAHADATSLLLQMDIEGAEYNALLAASDAVLSSFRMAVIEFHLLPALASARFLNMKFLPVLRKLLLHFDVVHAHANNCCGAVDLAGWEVPQVIELTFLRKADNPQPHHWQTPHPLDVVNVPAHAPLLLGPPWSVGAGSGADPLA
jgi:hypothetical protein